jgi:hypothetical protein
MTSLARSRSWVLSLAVLGCVAVACSSAPEPPTGSTSEAVIPGIHPPPLPPPPPCLSNASTCSSVPKGTPGFDPAFGPPGPGVDPRLGLDCGAEDTAFEANLASHFCTPEQYYYPLVNGAQVPGPVWATSFCEGIFPTNGTTEGWISCDSCTGNRPREGWYAVAWMTQDLCAGTRPWPAEGCSCVDCLQASQDSDGSGSQE